MSQLRFFIVVLVRIGIDSTKQNQNQPCPARQTGGVIHLILRDETPPRS